MTAVIKVIMMCSFGGIQQPKLIARNCQVICICGVDLSAHNYTYLFNKFKLFGMSTIHILLICQPFIYYCDVNKSVKFLLRRQDYHDFAPWWLKHQNGDGEMNIFIFHKHFFFLFQKHYDISFFIKMFTHLISYTCWYFFFFINILIFLISHPKWKCVFPSNIDCWRQRRAFQFLIFPKCPELL